MDEDKLMLVFLIGLILFFISLVAAYGINFHSKDRQLYDLLKQCDNKVECIAAVCRTYRYGGTCNADSK